MVSWQTWTLSAIASVTLPLYIRLLYVLLRNRKKHNLSSHFYTLTISQGFIDIIGFTSYYTSVNMRGFDALKPFYWSLNNTFFVQWSYTQTYLFEYGRIFGVVMISIQRCVTVSFPNSWVDKKLAKLPWWSFCPIQYFLPLIFCGNLFFAEMYFDSESTMNVVISPDTLETHYIKAALIPLISSIICAVSYGILIRTVKKNVIQTRRNDIRLSIQVVGLLIALLITCIHFCAQYVFNRHNMTEYVYNMRKFTPLWVGILTFINPWMIMLFNPPLRQAALFKPS